MRVDNIFVFPETLLVNTFLRCIQPSSHDYADLAEQPGQQGSAAAMHSQNDQCVVIFHSDLCSSRKLLILATAGTIPRREGQEPKSGSLLMVTLKAYNIIVPR